MGHIFDFSNYLNKEDVLSLDDRTQNTCIRRELGYINREILAIIEARTTTHQHAADYLYKLAILLERFVKRYGKELRLQHRLKIELLELIQKLGKFNRHGNNLSSELIRSTVTILKQQVGNPLTKEMINDLLVYETFEYLGLTSELGVQGKLNIDKVRDIDTYSMLLSEYRKPKIAHEYLEHFFQFNRKELLLQLVSSANSIKHIHYDFEYLHQFICLKLLMSLEGQDINTYINEQVRNVIA
ncbi:hypothetical protein [Acinetobacter indicus]|uniref:hypothetical protein n=1 Tax=Acinetobacter indicus TaxID=756892 RepID=UPI001BC870B1|nr:hypothetical protein [Acinetobacter indicus]